MINDQRTVWPSRLEIFTTSELNESDIPSNPSEPTSQSITRSSHDALSRPLSSGVNTKLEISSQCPCHLATNFPVRVFQTSICPMMHPDAMDRPSILNRTDHGSNLSPVRTLENPSRSLHILTVSSCEQVATQRPSGEKLRLKTTSLCVNIFLTRLWETIHIWGKEVSSLKGRHHR